MRAVAAKVLGITVAAVIASAPSAALAVGHASSAKVWSVGGEGMGFSLGASLGALSGDALERVWDTDFNNDFKVSELQWDLDGLYMLGIDGSVTITDRFRVNAGWWTALNEGDGKMVDLDWIYAPEVMVAEGLGLIDVTDNDWTHRSEHPDTTVDGITSFDVNLDIRAFSTGGMHINGILGYKYDQFEWSARGGSAVYSSMGFRDTAFEFEPGQLVIGYKQTYSAPYFGIGFDGGMGAFTLNAYLVYSPWVSAEDEDLHALRSTNGLLFEGDFSGGDYVAVGVTGTYNFTQNLFLGLALDYQDYSEIKGDVMISDVASGASLPEPIKDGGSVALDSLMISLSAGWNF